MRRRRSPRFFPVSSYRRFSPIGGPIVGRAQPDPHAELSPHKNVSAAFTHPCGG